MGSCFGWCERLFEAGGKVVVDTESGIDGYGKYLDQVVLCDPAAEYVVCGPITPPNHSLRWDLILFKKLDTDSILQLGRRQLLSLHRGNGASITNPGVPA